MTPLDRVVYQIDHPFLIMPFDQFIDDLNSLTGFGYTAEGVIVDLPNLIVALEDFRHYV